MYAERHVLDVVTASDGSATVYTPVVKGKVASIRYVKDGSTPFTDGVDVTVTGEISGAAIWTGTDVNATTTVAPRQPTHTTAGAASLYASGGVAVQDDIIVAAERIKLVVASGGDTKSGRFHITIS